MGPGEATCKSRAMSIDEKIDGSTRVADVTLTIANWKRASCTKS